ncbi:MAG: hypothetical protein SQA66_08515 [Candidatus Fervidibacter sacchari]
MVWEGKANFAVSMLCLLIAALFVYGQGNFRGSSELTVRQPFTCSPKRSPRTFKG